MLRERTKDLENEGRNEKRENDAAERADNDFCRFVPYAFFEGRKFVRVEVEVGDDVVDMLRVLAHIDAQTQSIHDDDDGHDEGDGECGGMVALENPHRRDEREDIGGVGAGHMAIGDGVVDVPAVLADIVEELDAFGDDSDSDRDNEEGD